MAFRIPEQHKTGFIKMLQLSEAEVSELRAQLASIPHSLKVRELAARISPQMPGVDAADLLKIVRTLYSLYQVRAAAEATLSQFVQDITAAIEDDEEELYGSRATSRAQQILSTLLGIDELSTWAKGFALHRDYQHIYHDAKVLTDVRPVFADADKPPLGAVITHTLKIVFHEAGGHEEIYLALDEDDIIKLRAVLDRAQAKAKALNSLLAQQGVRNLEF